jgi:hypothetical protein
MAKRSYGRQGFLNPADSEDSGYFKFSLKKRDEKPGRVTVVYRIADCSQNIELDFSVWGLNKPDEDDAPEKASDIIKMLEARRKKMRKFADAVATFAAKYDEALDLARADLEEYL